MVYQKIRTVALAKNSHICKEKLKQRFINNLYEKNSLNNGPFNMGHLL